MRIGISSLNYINRKAQRYFSETGRAGDLGRYQKEGTGGAISKNPGREWRPQGQPEEVRVHDFEIRQPENGKVAPYGVYDLGRKSAGWVPVWEWITTRRSLR